MEDVTPIIDKEVFDTFFKESYCTVEYGMVKEDFEEIASRGLEELFADETDITKLTDKNFIVYMRGDTYSEFEEIVEETFDDLNPEILDAVMDISVSMDNCDEITAVYWETKENLLKHFLKTLYAQKIKGMIEALDS